jgi:hypothetical protein
MSEPDASSIVKGITYLDFDPDVSSSPIAVGLNSSRIEKVLSADYGNSLATAISSIGATPVTLVIKEDCNISASATVPDNIFLEFQNAAKLIKTSSGAIEFEGLGILDTDTKIPYLEAFDPGDVFWSGDVYPREVSTEVIETNNSSLTDRLKFVDAALEGKAATINAYPRTIDGTATLTEFHTLYFTEGEYPNDLNTYGSTNDAAFLIQSNTRMHGSTNAIVYESTNDSNTYLITAYHMRSGGGQSNESQENMIVENLHIAASRDDVVPYGAHSTIIMGNCFKSSVRNCVFDRTHSYVVLGSYGDDGNYAEDSEIVDCKFIGIASQAASIINAKNCRIIRNFFDQRNTSGPSAFYSCIDVEPNNADDKVENLLIADNFFDCRDVTDSTKFVGAITVQGASKGSLKNVTIRNNIIFGADAVPDVTAPLFPLAGGISVYGIGEIYIHDNTVRSAFQRAIVLRNCRYARVYNNHTFQCADVNSDHVAVQLIAVRDSDIYDNLFNRSVNAVYQSTGILESENEYTVTTSGSSITNVRALINQLFYDFQVGLTVTINNADYVVATYTDFDHITTTASIGTLAAKTFGPSNVHTFTDIIDITSHGFNAGARVRLTGSGVPSGLAADTTYYVIATNANSLQLAASLADAINNIAVNLTSTGSGTNTLTPVMVTKFSNNTYRGNKAPDGTTLEPTGSSVVYGDYERWVRDSIAPAQITASQNNYNPGRSAYRLDLSTNASRNVTGLVFTTPQIDGEKHVVYNAGSNDIVLKNQDAGSTAANRFKNSTGADITLTAGQAADLEYIGGGVSRWAAFKRN